VAPERTLQFFSNKKAACAAFFYFLLSSLPALTICGLKVRVRKWFAFLFFDWL